MKGFGNHKKSKDKKIKNFRNDNFKEQIIHQAFKSHSEGKISEATKYYQSFIKHGFKDFRVFSNYGFILIGLGKLKEAEICLRKAIELKPDFAEAYLNLGNILNNLGKLKEAEICLRKTIELKPDFAEGHYNLGNILRNIRNLKEAEICLRRAIELNPKHINAHFNLGNILINLGNLEEAELLYRKAIKLDPNYVKAYYSLSLLKHSDENKIWQKQLFSETLLNQKSKEDQINIYFARANVLHNEKNYQDSSKFLKLANQLKLFLNKSNSDFLINKSKALMAESIGQEINQKTYNEPPESIFIVGMPRCGSTLLESILCMNDRVEDLGESEILEESFLDYKKSNEALNLAEIYWQKIKDRKKKLNKTTNKNLYNYLYAGIISNKIPNAKIIHCYRNPLDNILSIYRAHFTKGNQYSSSLVDCANVYLNQEKIMSKYKNRFRSKIYDLDYDSLVTNPNQEIKSLINWLGWEWEKSYLSPHLSSRSIQTRSKIEVRSPINSKSLGGWKHYRNMLEPAIEIITQTEKYRDLI